MFTFPGAISVRREAPDATPDDKEIALAIAEEADAPDEHLAADRSLTEKMNNSQQGYAIAPNYGTRFE